MTHPQIVYLEKSGLHCASNIDILSQAQGWRLLNNLIGRSLGAL